MSINNSLLNSCVIMIRDGVMESAVVDLKTREIVHRESSTVDVSSRNAIMDGIQSFLQRNGIDDGINIHVAVESPVHNGIICDDGRLRDLRRMMSMGHGRTIIIHSIADILAYGQWNLMGSSMRGISSKKSWSERSRVALVYLDRDAIGLSMVDSGRIIDGLDLNRDMYCVAHAGTSQSSDAISYAATLGALREHVDAVLHPDAIILYFAEDPQSVPPVSKSFIGAYGHGDVLRDVADSTVMMERGAYGGKPDYIASTEGGYGDVSVDIEDDEGNIRRIPLFSAD